MAGTRGTTGGDSVKMVGRGRHPTEFFDRRIDSAGAEPVATSPEIDALAQPHAERCSSFLPGQRPREQDKLRISTGCLHLALFELLASFCGHAVQKAGRR